MPWRAEQIDHLPWMMKTDENFDVRQLLVGQLQCEQLRRLRFRWATSGARLRSHCTCRQHTANRLSKRQSLQRIEVLRCPRRVTPVDPIRCNKLHFRRVRAFKRSVTAVVRVLQARPPPGNVRVQLGDARSLRTLVNQSIDAVMTSPPYLNAIDYIWGHRLA